MYPVGFRHSPIRLYFANFQSMRQNRVRPRPEFPQPAFTGAAEASTGSDRPGHALGHSGDVGVCAVASLDEAALNGAFL